MALRAVPDHPKFANLKALLGRPKSSVLGLLEAIWHFTGRFTPQGNIGKYTDEAIEAWVEWDGQPGVLIAALIDSHWIDRSDIFRLVVHDWHQHADNATKLSLKRSNRTFCLHGVSTVSRQSGDARTAALFPAPAPQSAKAEPLKPALFVLPAWISKSAWDDFEEMRRKIKAPLTDRARRNIVAELVRIEGTGQHAEDVLNQSITNSWRGVFPLTESRSNGNKYGNRGQARTDSNVEAAKRAAEAIAREDAGSPGGSAASGGERGDVAPVRAGTMRV